MVILSLVHNLSFYTWNLKNTLIAELLAKTTNPYANLSLNLCNFFPEETPDLSKVTYQMGVQSHPPTSRNPDSEFCGDLNQKKNYKKYNFMFFPENSLLEILLMTRSIMKDMVNIIVPFGDAILFLHGEVMCIS